MFCSDWADRTRTYTDQSPETGKLVVVQGEILEFLPSGAPVDEIEAVVIRVDDARSDGQAFEMGPKAGFCAGSLGEYLAAEHSVGQRGIFLFNRAALVDGAQTQCGQLLAGITVEPSGSITGRCPWLPALAGQELPGGPTEAFVLENPTDLFCPGEARQPLVLTWEQLNTLLDLIGVPDPIPHDNVGADDWLAHCLAGIHQVLPEHPMPPSP